MGFREFMRRKHSLESSNEASSGWPEDMSGSVRLNVNGHVYTKEGDIPTEMRREITSSVKDILDEVRTPEEAAAIDHAMWLLDGKAYELEQLPEDTSQ